VSKIAQSFFENARITPDKTAIWCDEISISYAQLADLVRRWNCSMAARGMKSGDHIGVLLPNCIEFVALMVLAADMGVVLVPLNTTLPLSAICRAFQASDVRHVVGTAQVFAELIPSKAGDLFFVDGVWLSIDEGLEGVPALKELLENQKPDCKPLLSTQEEEPFILTMTSGSTGDPKPIILTQRTKYNRSAAAIELYSITSSDRILAATPLYHSLAERLVLIPLISGGTSILMTRFSPTEWLRCVREQKVSFTIAVSSQLRQIAEQLGGADSPSIHSLRCVVSSSAQLDTRLKIELISKLHCKFHECYGTSEIAIASNLDGESDTSKLQSVGLAAPGVDIRVLLENGQTAESGEPGEIACKTPMIFGGYYKRPDLTAAAMCGDYFRTGDIGKIDSDGYLYYLGRTKDIIITGGINVYPKDVESVLLEYPDISECAVFSLPDDKLGEIIAAALVFRDAAEFDQRKIRRHCAERLADFQQPRKYFILQELPKNGMGKIIKRSLPAFCGIEL
jgi:long-chain acyl-CoA synthetase